MYPPRNRRRISAGALVPELARRLERLEQLFPARCESLEYGFRELERKLEELEEHSPDELLRAILRAALDGGELTITTRRERG